MQKLNLRLFAGRRLPIILQTEQADCALACVAMVASYFGHKIAIDALRRRYSVSLKGVTLKGLIDIAASLGLKGRPVRLEMPSLSDLKCPSVLHWGLNHFIVLKSTDRTGIVVHDPIVGQRHFTYAEASKFFTGVAVEFSPGPNFTKRDETNEVSLRFLVGKVSGLWGGVAQLLALGLVLQVLAIVAPFYLQWIVDEALVAGDRDLITVLGIGFGLLTLIQFSISSLRSWLVTSLSTQLNFQWLGNAFQHLVRLPITFFERRHLGDIVSRFGSIRTIQTSITSQFVEAVIDGVLIVTTVVVMSLYSGMLTGIAAAVVAVYFLLRSLLIGAIREATVEQIAHTAKQYTNFLETARGIQSVRLFNRGSERTSVWTNLLADQFNADLRLARLQNIQQNLSGWMFAAERVAIVWLAALATLDSKLTVGMVFAFLSYKEQFSQRGAALIDRFFELKMLRMHGERVADLLLTPAEDEDPERGPPLRIDSGKLNIELREVRFRYASGEPEVLRGIDLAIREGECIAITGKSGCGKTTLVKLLLGLVQPSSGDLTIGGHPLADLGRAPYRDMVGTVMQEDYLFSGTIGDNICFYDPSPDQDFIEDCARASSIHEEIMEMPMRYNTLIGDIGTGLSGGQKQRILLARALYKRPRVLVLDEATSHLDLRNEQYVSGAIERLALTRIVVAHRPETIAKVDRVVVLEHGRVASDRLQSKEG